MEIKLDTVSYIDDNNVERLEDITLCLNFRRTYGVIGKSGSGKSYLGRLLALIIKPYRGEILYDKIKVKNLANKSNYEKLYKNIGYVSDETENTFLTSTIYDELRSVLSMVHYCKKDLDKRIYDVLKMVRLPKSYALRDPATLSTGESKKLKLAMALIYNPKLIILDNLSEGLDNYEQKQIIRLIKLLKNKYNKTIVIITNDMEFLIKAVDEIIVMSDSKVVANGDKYNILKETRLLKKIGLGVPNTINFSDIVLRKKHLKIGYREQINDLIKDVYRYAEWGVDHHE